jgi:hypothetical protein
VLVSLEGGGALGVCNGFKKEKREKIFNNKSYHKNNNKNDVIEKLKQKL